MALSAKSKEGLLKAARASVEQALGAHVEGASATHTALAEDAREPRGAFVSLHSKNDHALRGCIGTFAATEPLAEVVTRMAKAAAFEDPRFPPLGADELPQVKVEISALTPPTPIRAEHVQVGRHGLLVARGHRRGVLLPQVPIEWGWDREEFLAQTCQKAGLPPDAWRAPETELLAFEAEVFSEP